MNPEEIAKKHSQGKSPEELEKEQDELKEEVALNGLSLEQELLSFSDKFDDLIDPESEKVLCRVKRPSSEQNKRFIPPELAKYRKNPEEIPYEVAVKYEDGMYELMAELIVEPEHDAKWWKTNTGDEFMALFQAHLFNVKKKLGEKVQSFLSPTTE